MRETVRSILLELVSNRQFAKSFVKRMLVDIQKSGVKLKIDNVKYDDDSSKVYSRLDLSHIDIEHDGIITSIIDFYKKEAQKNNYILSYKKQKQQVFDFAEDGFDMIPNNTFTANYIVFLKQITTKRIKPSRFVYHSSLMSNREGIKKNGLVPKNAGEWNMLDVSLDYPPAIFAGNHPEDRWNSSKTHDVWQIDTQGLKNKWWEDLNFNKREEFVMTFEPIPVGNLRRIS